jgi:hypothetical protein
MINVSEQAKQAFDSWVNDFPVGAQIKRSNVEFFASNQRYDVAAYMAEIDRLVAANPGQVVLVD